MKNSLDFLYRGLRKMYPVKYKLYGQLDKTYTDTINAADGDLIYKSIIAGKPLMISRFGATEMNCLVNYFDQRKSGLRHLRYITGQSKYYRWDDLTMETMSTLSGFFPDSFAMLERFSRLVYEDMKLIDILGSWLKEEVLFEKELGNAKKVGFLNLEPYNHKEPWSRALEGKKVLVVHPFTESIQKQYLNRTLLFNDPTVLPKFDLKTLKAVQSISKNPTGYSNWFEALDSMKDKISQIDFDIAIIGCGAYGMSLAAHVKRLGKQSVHLGGATQLLFGITGKRWESSQYEYGKKLINRYWVRPLEEEVPQNHSKVEEGCYW
jgi:hypothetical protein